MTYSQVALEEKIMDMYPDIVRHKISIGLRFDQEKDAWVIKFKKDRHELETYLDKKDADECMEGKKCVHLGVQLGDFIDNFERPHPA